MSTETRSSATVIGIVDEIGEVKTFGQKGFQKLAVVVKTDADSQYPQLIEVSFSGKNMDKANALGVGDAVRIECNIRGRRANTGRVFTELDAWKIDVVAKAAPRTSDRPALDDDLPF